MTPGQLIITILLRAAVEATDDAKRAALQARTGTQSHMEVATIYEKRRQEIEAAYTLAVRTFGGQQ